MEPKKIFEEAAGNLRFSHLPRMNLFLGCFQHQLVLNIKCGARMSNCAIQFILIESNMINRQKKLQLQTRPAKVDEQHYRYRLHQKLVVANQYSIFNHTTNYVENQISLINCFVGERWKAFDIFPNSLKTIKTFCTDACTDILHPQTLLSIIDFAQLFKGHRTCGRKAVLDGTLLCSVSTFMKHSRAESLKYFWGFF